MKLMHTVEREGARQTVVEVGMGPRWICSTLMNWDSVPASTPLPRSSSTVPVMFGAVPLCPRGRSRNDAIECRR